MTDYIERNAAIADITMMAEDRRIPVDSYGGEIIGEVISILRRVPAADVREVVLCKDCCFREQCAFDGDDNFFCASGKRRADHV